MEQEFLLSCDFSATTRSSVLSAATGGQKILYTSMYRTRSSTISKSFLPLGDCSVQSPADGHSGWNYDQGGGVMGGKVLSPAAIVAIT